MEAELESNSYYVESSEFLKGFEYLLPLLDFPIRLHPSPREMLFLLKLAMPSSATDANLPKQHRPSARLCYVVKVLVVVHPASSKLPWNHLSVVLQ